MQPYIHTAVGVLGIVLNSESQILLALSQHRGWEPPQGFLNCGEAPVPALHREVLEETGYIIQVKALTGVYHCLNDGVPILSLCFLCEACERVTTKVEESLDVRWVDKEDLSKFITHESHFLRVADALDGQVSVRDYSINPFSVIRSLTPTNNQDNS